MGQADANRWPGNASPHRRVGGTELRPLAQPGRYEIVSNPPRPEPTTSRLDVVGRVLGGVLVITAGEACVVDLTAVTFLGSAGLGALLEATALGGSAGTVAHRR